MRTLVLAALLALGAGASEEHEEGGGARTGQGKAVLEANAEKGMRLSQRAWKRLGVKTAPVAKGGSVRLPAGALVVAAEDVGVYRLRDGWLKHVDVEVASRERGFVAVRSAELAPGDQVVVAGAPLLRVAELDVFGGEEAGHGH